MATISDVSKSIGTIVEIAKRIKNYELVREVGDLQRMAFELFAENAELRAQLAAAKRNNDFADKATFRDGMYWVEGDNTPFCQRCWEVDHNMVHLEKTEYGSYLCPEELYQRKINRASRGN